MPATLTPAVARRLVIAPLLVLLSALAYQAAVHPSYQVVRVPLVAHPTAASDRVVRLTLPDLSTLRGSTPILSGLIANGPARQRARVLLDGFSRAEIDLAPGEVGAVALVLSDGMARAVTGDSGGQHVVTVAGDHDDWRLMTLEVANVHAAVGDVVAIVPAKVPPAPPALAVAWAALAALGALAAMVGGTVRTPWLRRAHQVVWVVAAAALTVAWLGPVVGDIRVLVRPWVVGAAVSLALAPALVGAGRRCLAWTITCVRAAARVWRRHATTCERGAVLLGLVALAVSQPLFDVLRASPEFFIARNTPTWVAVTAAAAIALGLPLLLLAVERGLRRLAPSAASAFFLAVVALLVALMVHPWLRRWGGVHPWLLAGLAVGVGLLVALVTRRTAGMRHFMAALAPAALVVPILLFTNDYVRDALVPSSARLAPPPLRVTPPIVVVVFDEFPLHSLLDGAGEIDAVRYPGFAELARGAWWFREATAVSSQTVWAVPAIASGRYPVVPHAVPTLRYYPENLFTLLAARYQMHVFGRFLQLCPEAACVRDLAGPGDGLVSLLADLGVVYLHIVAPKPLADRLPPVVGDWMGFARAGRWRTVDGRRVRNDRLGEFERFLATIDARPARLYFLHSLLPHMPFEYVPSLRRYDAPDYQSRDEKGAGLFLRTSAEYADALHQRHLLQVGFVDTLVGRLVARLRQLGIYDESLVVVTADHGASFREGVPRRAAREQNRADILRVPLFIKVPGQPAAAAVDGIVESVDILPTIAAVVGAPLPFHVDGQSLAGGNRPTRTTRTFIERGQNTVSRRDVTDWRSSSEVSLTRRLARFGTGGYDAFYAIPGSQDLMGRLAAELPRRAGTLRVRLSAKAAFADVDLASETLPLHVRGRLLTTTTQPLAVVVNGRIAAITMPYGEGGATVFATMIPESVLRHGRNDVETFLVERSGEATTLVSTLE